MFHRYILGLSLLFTTLAYAGHEKGGVIITYKSMASVTGNPLAYLVEAYAVYETVIVPPANVQITITSSCFTNYAIALPRIGGLIPVHSADYCTPGTNIGGTNGLAHYRDTIILAGTCSDFLFAHIGGIGRYFTTSNIDDNFSGSAYFGVSLDNTLGPNSCPTLPISHFIQGLCINTPLVLYGFSEPDGDSLHFTPSSPQRHLSGTVSNFPYKTGYSQANQVGSNSGFTVNPLNGVVQTNISSQGNYIISIGFTEYR